MAQAKADEAKAIANLNNYMSNSVGVGEHPDVVTEVAKLLKEVAEARDIQETILAMTTQENSNEETSQTS